MEDRQPTYAKHPSLEKLENPLDTGVKINLLTFKNDALYENSIYGLMGWKPKRRPKRLAIKIDSIKEITVRCFYLDNRYYEFILVFIKDKWINLGVMKAMDFINFAYDSGLIDVSYMNIDTSKKQFLVYEIENLLTGETYRGKTSLHRWDYENYMGSGVLIKAAIRHYGVNNFSRKCLRRFNSEETAYDYEFEVVETIHENPNSYNLIPGGRGGGFSWDNSKRITIKQEEDSSLEVLAGYLATHEPNTDALKQARVVINRRGLTYSIKNEYIGVMGIDKHSTLWMKTKCKTAMTEVLIKTGYRPRIRKFIEILLEDHKMLVQPYTITKLMKEITIEVTLAERKQKQ